MKYNTCSCLVSNYQANFWQVEDKLDRKQIMTPQEDSGDPVDCASTLPISVFFIQHQSCDILLNSLGHVMSVDHPQVGPRHLPKNTCRSCTCESGSDYSHGSWQIWVMILDFCRYLTLPVSL